MSETVAPAAVRLRSTREEDLGFVLRAEGTVENRPFIGRWPRERHLEALSHEEVRHMVIERTGDGAPVGYVILTGVGDPGGKICLKRITVAEKGRGYGRAALRRVARLVFEDLGAHRLWLNVKEENSRARGLYESEGFVTDGVLRDAFWNGERYESLIVMSKLESEYAA